MCRFDSYQGHQLQMSDNMRLYLRPTKEDEGEPIAIHLGEVINNPPLKYVGMPVTLHNVRDVIDEHNDRTIQLLLEKTR